MKQKENLLYKAMEIKNQIAEVKGEEVKEINTRTWQFVDEARNSKVYELKERIESLEKSLEKAKEEVKFNAWLQTEDGKAYTARLDEANNNLEEGYTAANKKMFEEVENLIKTRLGSKWGICSLDDCRAEFGIIDESKEQNEDGTIQEIFGHSFDISFGRWYEDEKTLKINYGCLGEFDPKKDAERIEFLQGLAKFSADIEMQEDIKRIVTEFCAFTKELRENVKAVEETKNVA